MIVPRPYKLYGKTEFNIIKDALTAITDQWKAAWFVSNASSISINVESACVQLAESDLSNMESCFCAIGDHTVDILLSNKSVNELLANIINTPLNLVSGKVSDISRFVVNKCLLSLVLAIAKNNAIQLDELILVDSTELPEIALNSGVVRLTIVLGSSKIFIFIPYEIMQLYINKQPVHAAEHKTPLYNRSSCKFKENTTLGILAGTTELEFGTVTNLCVGDVIRLDSRIDEPMIVTLDDGMQVCKAFIGKKDDRKVAKVILSKQV